MSYGDLEVLLRSRVPLIVVESRDESRVLKLLQRACRRAPSVMPAPAAAHAGDLTGKLPQGLPLFEWTITDGLRRLDSEGGGNQRNLSDPADVLRHIRATNLCAVYALVDFHPFLKDPVHVRMLKDICLEYERCPRTLVLLSAEIDMPRELDDLSARRDLALPDRAERGQIVAVVATLYTANARRAPPSAQAILAEMTATRPLSILMAERISALRRWAAGRAVPAG